MKLFFLLGLKKLKLAYHGPVEIRKTLIDDTTFLLRSGTKDIKHENIPDLCDKFNIKKNLINPIYLS